MELQIPPLRYAPVGMTKGEWGFHSRSVARIPGLKSETWGARSFVADADTLPFVIPTGAKRSGGTCGSQRPVTALDTGHHPPLCHPDRSVAKRRDLQCASTSSQIFPRKRPGLRIPSGSKRRLISRIRGRLSGGVPQQSSSSAGCLRTISAPLAASRSRRNCGR